MSNSQNKTKTICVDSLQFRRLTL